MAEHGLKHPERYSYELMRSKIESCLTLKMQALLCLLYGCGVRVSEANKVQKEDIREIKLKERPVLRVYSPTLKNRSDHNRFIYLLLEKENWIAQPLIKYAQLSQGILFPYDRRTIHTWVVKETGINPHGFRAIRGCHLVSEFGFTDQQLTKFMGWTDSRPAKYYIKLRGEDIVPGF